MSVRTILVLLVALVVLSAAFMPSLSGFAGDDPTPARAAITTRIEREWGIGVTRSDADEVVRRGLARYEANRAIHTELRERNWLVLRLFDGRVPFVMRRMQLSPETDADGLRVRNFDALQRPDAAEGDERIERVATTFHTLERYLGWPAVQVTLAMLKERGANHELTIDVLRSVLSDVTGRDFAWLLRDSLDPRQHYDYAVTALQSEPMGDGYRTSVVVQRLGTAIFSGSSEEPQGHFESGRGVEVEVTFGDGMVREYWDGRAERREFVYQSRTPVVAAYVDPDRTVLLDRDRMNNGRRVSQGPVAEPARWSLYWVAWLQDLLLTVPTL